MTKKKNRGGKFLLGALIGAGAALLLAPKSGKETRGELGERGTLLKKRLEDSLEVFTTKVEGIFGQADRESKKKYREVKAAILEKVTNLKKTEKQLDRKKYEGIVDGVLLRFKSDLSLSAEAVKKLGTAFKKDWERVKKSLNA